VDRRAIAGVAGCCRGPITRQEPLELLGNISLLLPAVELHPQHQREAASFSF
jgi:hypothetical protein